MIMDKKGLVDTISKNIDVKKKLTSAVVDELFNLMVGTLSRGEDIKIHGFGTFKISVTKEREIPCYFKDGQVTKVEEHNRVSFRPCSSLKEAVR